MSRYPKFRNVQAVEKWLDETGYESIDEEEARWHWQKLVPPVVGGVFHPIENVPALAVFSNGRRRYLKRVVISTAIAARKEVNAHDCNHCDKRLGKPEIHSGPFTWFCSIDCRNAAFMEEMEWQANNKKQRRALSLAKRQLLSLRKFLQGNPEVSESQVRELAQASTSLLS